MGVFDQAARYAAQAEPSAVIQGLFAKLGLDPSFDGWFDTRALPLPGGPDRAADLVAMLDPASTTPTLLVIEFQSQHDPEKLEVTLEEIAILRARTRHGPERQGRYRALTALVYLRGRCPNSVLDMTLPDGIGTRHIALVWDLQDDPAQTTLEAVAQGALSWGHLFWVPLMAGSQETGVIQRWREIVERTITDKRRRGDLVGIALVFSELAGCRQEWERGLEEVTMTESEVVNGWIQQGETRGRIEERRQALLDILEGRFAEKLTPELVQWIKNQDSLSLMNEWSRRAVRVGTFEEFLAVLHQ